MKKKKKKATSIPPAKKKGEKIGGKKKDTVGLGDTIQHRVHISHRPEAQ